MTHTGPNALEISYRFFNQKFSRKPVPSLQLGNAIEYLGFSTNFMNFPDKHFLYIIVSHETSDLSDII